MENDSEPSPKDSLPPGIPPPPPPRPDLRDFRGEGATYGERDEPGKRGKRGKKDKSTTPRHPTDPYEPLKKPRRLLARLVVVFAILVLLAAGAAALLVFAGPGRYVRAGYEVVKLRSEEAVIDAAPDRATLYLGPGKISYSAPRTIVPVAFLAREVALSGDFHEEVSITCAKTALPPQARFAKDLEVYALEFRDGGITLKGRLKGRVASNRPAPR